MRDQWIEWLQEKQRHFFYGVLFVICAFFIAFQVFGQFHKTTHQRFLSVSQAFDHWMLHGEAFEKLQAALKQTPELESKYSARIAERLMAQNESEKAAAVAQDIFKRVLQQTPQHTAFAEVSLLIAKGQYHEALKESIALKGSAEPESLLYAFNLVRIASLYRQLETRGQELAALEELEQYLTTHPKAASVLTACFSEGNLTLLDYIHQRKQ